MRKNLVSLLIFAILFSWMNWSCSNNSGKQGEKIEQPKRTQPTKDRQSVRVAQRDDSEVGTAAPVTDNSKHALVQLLIFGMMAFEIDDSAGSRRVWALAPKIGGPERHRVTASRGKYKYDMSSGGTYSWKKIRLPLRGTELKVVFSSPQPGLKADFSPLVGRFPVSRLDAERASWMLRADKITAETPVLDRRKAKYRFLVDSGELKTCGLVHEGETSSVCKVRAGNAFQAMSEYMVVQWRVQKDTKVKLLVGRTMREIEIHPTGDSHSGYAKLYDIAFTNLPRATGRTKRTRHIDVLRKKLFRESETQWTNFYYEDADCYSGKQPACISRYQGWNGLPSGGDRPLCPFVGVGP